MAGIADRIAALDRIDFAMLFFFAIFSAQNKPYE